MSHLFNVNQLTNSSLHSHPHAQGLLPTCVFGAAFRGARVLRRRAAPGTREGQRFTAGLLSRAAAAMGSWDSERRCCPENGQVKRRLRKCTTPVSLRNGGVWRYCVCVFGDERAGGGDLWRKVHSPCHHVFPIFIIYLVPFIPWGPEIAHCFLRPVLKESDAD